MPRKRTARLEGPCTLVCTTGSVYTPCSSCASFVPFPRSSLHARPRARFPPHSLRMHPRQNMIIAILSHFEVIQDTLTYTQEEVASGLSNFLVCIEMFIAALAHHKYYGYGVSRPTAARPQRWLERKLCFFA